MPIGSAKALMTRGLPPASRPGVGARTLPATTETLYKQRHRVENLFARLKDWRRIATR